MPENLLPHHGHAVLYPQLFSPGESNLLFSKLLQLIPWKQEHIRIFGKQVLQPRLTAWFADDQRSYSYSGVTMGGLPWSSELLYVRTRLTEQTGCTFNSALLNLYRHGEDYVGWHRDNEKALGSDPVIASVSFGTLRFFQLREYRSHQNLITIPLASGSVLVMSGETQSYWEHRLPKQKKILTSRINITFRTII
jgi:alkylated DNA repair dioxygenase AlkB